jgi:hypothetical protein
VGALSDRILLAVVRHRLAQCRRHGDQADKFGDQLIALLAAEIQRRKVELAGWETAAAERAQRVAADREFQSLGPQQARLQ